MQRMTELTLTEGQEVPGGATLLNLSHPDCRPECKASIGLGQSHALWSTLSVTFIQHRLAGQLPLEPSSSRYREVSLRGSGVTFDLVKSSFTDLNSFHDSCIIVLSYCHSCIGVSTMQ